MSAAGNASRYSGRRPGTTESTIMNTQIPNNRSINQGAGKILIWKPTVLMAVSVDISHFAVVFRRDMLASCWVSSATVFYTSRGSEVNPSLCFSICCILFQDCQYYTRYSTANGPGQIAPRMAYQMEVSDGSPAQDERHRRQVAVFAQRTRSSIAARWKRLAESVEIEYPHPKLVDFKYDPPTSIRSKQHISPSFRGLRSKGRGIHIWWVRRCRWLKLEAEINTPSKFTPLSHCHAYQGSRSGSIATSLSLIGC